tara:strand:- start:119 stop:2392 length:2274 start_codon:yes stop_codon:yes gene_type:complete
MARSMRNALLDKEKLGTLANPGEATSLGPTIPMRVGAILNPYLQKAKDLFPEEGGYAGEYGQFDALRSLGNLLLGDSPERTAQMAEGYPHQYTGAGPNDPIIRPEIVDLAGALPIGTVANFGKAAVVPGAAFAASKLAERGLGITDAVKKAQREGATVGDILLGAGLQSSGKLDEAMVGGEAGAAALARIGNTAPQRAMELAEQMESAGRSRDEIWAATADMGYPVYRGPDGKLRFEIDDSAVRFKEAPVGKSRADLAGDYFESKGVPRTKRATGQYPELDDEALDWADANRQSNPTVPVYESIIHPEMQQAYPDSGVRIGRVDPGTRDLSGYFDPATKEIRYGGGAIMDTDNAGTALHELQHVTQEAEGFARGGNPKFASGMDEAAQFEAARRAYNSANFSADGLTDDVLLHELTGRPMPSQPPKAWDELSRKEQVKWLEAGRYDMYRALAGEAEARQVQARMDMTPAERAYKPFYADFDVPEADQIVRYGDGPSASSPKLPLDETIAQPSVDEFIGKLLDDELPMDEASRMQRAGEMGFDTSAYHGTAGNIEEFSKNKQGSVTKALSAKGATWFVDDPSVASGYARFAAEDAPVQKLIDASQAAERRGDWDAAQDLIAEAERLEPTLVDSGNANVMPVELKAGNFKQIDAKGATMGDLTESQLNEWVKEAKQEGYDGLKIENFSDNADWGNYNPATHYAVFDLKNIRSKFAKFDPSKKDSAKILASVAGASVLPGLYDPNTLQDEKAMQRALLQN